jgi:hypothetical protein
MNAKTIATLDAIQAGVNPAYLDRLPRPHDLLASDIASHIADAARDLADDLTSGTRWRVADLTAADAQDATLLASRAYDAAWLELCRLPLETLAVVCAYAGDKYHGDQFAARECAVDAVRALRDRLVNLPHRRRDDADNAIRGAVAAMVAIALAEGGAE